MERWDRLAKGDGQGRGKLICTGIVSTDIPRIWPCVDELVDKALLDSLGQHSKEDLYDELLRTEKQLWVAFDREPKLIVITGIENFPSLRACMIGYMAGSGLDKCVGPLLNLITEWATAQDCDVVYTLASRPGIERMLRTWRPGPRMMIRELK